MYYTNLKFFCQNYAQKTFEKVKQGAFKAKEYIITKIAGNIEKVLSVAALVSAPVIGAILGNFKLGLLVGLGLFISIYVTWKKLFLVY